MKGKSVVEDCLSGARRLMRGGKQRTDCRIPHRVRDTDPKNILFHLNRFNGWFWQIHFFLHNGARNIKEDGIYDTLSFVFDVRER